MDYLVSCNYLVKIVKVYMLPFCGEIKMNNFVENCLAGGDTLRISVTSLQCPELECLDYTVC